MTSIIINKRFCGPPNSGNGGYVCGKLARNIPGAAQITLHAPPPLETKLDIVATGENSWDLREGATIIATGRPTSIQLNYLDSINFHEVNEASLLTSLAPEEHKHPMPTCFVCGPARAHGDGLRLFPRPIAQQTEGAKLAVLAVAWTPNPDLSEIDGLVAPEFIWSALDCPTGYASCYDPVRGSFDRTQILLGRMSAKILRRPHPGENCIVASWSLGKDGRKRFAESAIYSDDSELLAFAFTTWIEAAHPKMPP